jgi:hypothetical protein
MIEKFKEMVPRGAPSSTRGKAISQDLKDLVREGKIVQRKYTAEDICEIVFQVKARGLKKKVAQARW